MEILNKIDIGIRRKLATAAIVIAGAGHLYFLKNTLASILSYSLIGQVDVATVVGALTLLSAFLFYRRKL